MCIAVNEQRNGWYYSRSIVLLGKLHIIITVYLLQCFWYVRTAGLAQSVERQALNLMVEGSSPSFGVFLLDDMINFIVISDKL